MVVSPLSIFISYAREDSSDVDRLEADLRTRGFRPWVDRSRLEGGQAWPNALEEAIGNCDVLLVVLSPQAVKSHWVENEYLKALDLHKCVIPLEYQQCNIPLALYRLQRIDFNYDEQGLDSLLRALRAVELQPSLVPPVFQPTPNASPALPPNSPRRIKRRKVVLGGIGVLVIAAVVGGYEVISHDFGSSHSQTPIATKLSKGWNPIKAFSPSRDDFGITPFISSDGKQRVLIDGGGSYTGAGYTDNCQTFDPEKEIWTKTRGLQFKRVGHTSTLLPDSGNILVAGGMNENILDLSELYDPNDPKAGSWPMVTRMNHQRSAHSAVSLGKDRVLVVGGWGGGRDNDPTTTLKSAEIYDYNNGSPLWKPIDDMAFRRQLPGCVLVPYKSGFGVLVMGGFNGSPLPNTGLHETELYDLQTQKWIPRASMHVGRWGFGVLWLQSIKKVLVVGGIRYGTSLQNATFTPSAELYDVDQDQWTRISDMKYERGAYDGTSNAIPLNDSTVLVVGNDAGRPSHRQGSSEILVLNLSNPNASKWNPPVSISQTNLNQPVGRSVLLEDTGQVLFVGNGYGNEYAFIYVPEVPYIKQQPLV